MREVEIKAALKNPVAVMEKLEALGCEFSEATTQDDTVYVENPGPVSVFVANPIFLRIRVNNGTETIFTMKYHPGRNPEDPGSMPVEHETRIEKRDEMEAMLALLGMKEAMRIKKTRRTAHHKNWELCWDEVEGLGSFLEVEQMMEHDDDVEPVKEEMLAFFATLGIDRADMLAKRYDIALLEKIRPE